VHPHAAERSALHNFPDAERARVRLTPYTIVQPARMCDQLARVRREGYATTEEEMTLGACSVAVPVRVGAAGDVVAAVGVVVPTLKRDRTRLVTALRVAAQGIGRSVER
jgi:DNA-binding IclR family transcriptional regulator